MKAYVVTTGAAFGLLALAHVARVLEEGTHLLRQPVFVATTAGAVVICAWAATLLWKLRRGGP